jgi:hypothetical protein
LPAAPPGGFPASLGYNHTTGFMVDSKLRTPYATTFGLSISRNLPRGFSLETAYAGRIGRKLLVQTDFAGPLVNFKDPKSGQTWIQAMGIITDLVDKNSRTSEIPKIPFFENVFAPLARNGLTASQSAYNAANANAPSWLDFLYELDTSDAGSTIYGPFTFFQQQFDWLPAWTNFGQSSYHSFQLTVRKRFGGGLQADFNYSLAKSLDNGSALESEGQGAGQMLNAFDHRQTIGYSNFDVRHQINSNFVADLPFGQGRRWGGSLNPALNALFGGWRLTGIVRWRTGFPFDVLNCCYPTDYALTGPATLKPGAHLPEIKIVKSSSGGPNIFADPAAASAVFVPTASGFSGSRNILHGPSFFDLDTGVHKIFKIGERREIQFRWETFNLTNRVNFDGRPNARGNRGLSADLNAPSTFGRLRSTAGTPRVMQFGLRYQF